MENLNQVRHVFLEKIEHLSDEALYWKEQPKDWNVLQVIEHLALYDDYVVEMIKNAVQQQQHAPTENPNLLVLLNRTAKVSAPDFSIPSEDVEKEVVLAHFSQARARLQATLTDITEEERNTITMKHRRFNDMSIHKWLELVALHEQRHIEQVVERIVQYNSITK